MEQLIPIIDTAVMMFVNVTHQRLTKETVMTHRAIVDAISDRDPIGAKTAMMIQPEYDPEADPGGKRKKSQGVTG